jgi:hypothetical protein
VRECLVGLILQSSYLRSSLHSPSSHPASPPITALLRHTLLDTANPLSSPWLAHTLPTPRDRNRRPPLATRSAPLPSLRPPPRNPRPRIRSPSTSTRRRRVSRSCAARGAPSASRPSRTPRAARVRRASVLMTSVRAAWCASATTSTTAIAAPRSWATPEPFHSPPTTARQGHDTGACRRDIISVVFLSLFSPASSFFILRWREPPGGPLLQPFPRCWETQHRGRRPCHHHRIGNIRQTIHK